MEDEDKKNVVEFKVRDDGDVVKARPGSECRHWEFEVDNEEREVYCGRCDKQLDPIFVLMRLTEIYRERDYKYDKITQFETEERARAEKQRARYAAKSGATGKRSN